MSAILSTGSRLEQRGQPVLPHFSHNARGALWMIGAAVFFSLNAAVVKELALTGIDSLQTVFVRSALGLAIPLPFVIAARSALRTKQFSI